MDRHIVLLTILVLLVAVMIAGSDDFPILLRMLQSAFEAIGGEEGPGRGVFAKFMIRQIHKSVDRLGGKQKAYEYLGCASTPPPSSAKKAASRLSPRWSRRHKACLTARSSALTPPLPSRSSRVSCSRPTISTCGKRCGGHHHVHPSHIRHPQRLARRRHPQPFSSSDSRRR